MPSNELSILDKLKIDQVELLKKYSIEPSEVTQSVLEFISFRIKALENEKAH
jgi:hypothetical protein